MTGHHAGPRSSSSGDAETAATDVSTDATDDALEHALESLRAGEPILVHDAADREARRTDLSRRRRHARCRGSLAKRCWRPRLCRPRPRDRRDVRLAFYADEIDHPAAADHELGYDDRSSFSLTVNHRDTYTGITDADRSKTIQHSARQPPSRPPSTCRGVSRPRPRPPAESRPRLTRPARGPHRTRRCTRRRRRPFARRRRL